MSILSVFFCIIIMNLLNVMLGKCEVARDVVRGLEVMVEPMMARVESKVNRHRWGSLPLPGMGAARKCTCTAR